MTRARRCAGFTLVELMVAMVIGTIAVAGALQVYAHGRDMYRVNERIARVQEQARVALAMIEPDIEMAGYYGFTQSPQVVRFVRGANPGVTIATSSQLRQFSVRAGGPLPPRVSGLPAGAHACGTNFAVDVSTPLQASNNSFMLGPSRTSSCDPYQRRPQPGADTLTARRVDTRSTLPEANRLQVYAARNSGLSSQLLFADGNAPGVVDDDHRVQNLVVRTYYVARDSVGQRDFPALRVKSLTRSGINLIFDEDEVMPGVEDLQVQFGIAPLEGGDGRAARYVDPDAADVPWSQIVAVRLWLRVRSDSPEPTFTDSRTYQYADVTYTPTGDESHFRRVLIARTITLRNARLT
jgi:type IV pilus assembly protein PilW